MVFLQVFNSGSGVADDEKAKIFDRLYTTNYSRARESGGNGLGLAILKGIADRNAWRVSVGFLLILTAQISCWVIWL